jgi:hypothetical protein
VTGSAVDELILPTQCSPPRISEAVTGDAPLGQRRRLSSAPPLLAFRPVRPSPPVCPPCPALGFPLPDDVGFRLRISSSK